jgi:hypothetical protein
MYSSDEKLNLRLVDNTLFVLNERIKSIQIFSISGRLLFQNTAAKNNVDVSALSAGIYMVRVQTDSGIKAAKFRK